jgi:hypothetical protein
MFRTELMGLLKVVERGDLKVNREETPDRAGATSRNAATRTN